MQIDHERFVDWAQQKFGDIIVSGDEVKINDPWWINDLGLPDTSHKCWINTTKCCYRAFKSEKTGHLIEFVMEAEGCDWEDAINLLSGEENYLLLEKKLLEFLSGSQEKEDANKPIENKAIELPPHTFLISDLPDSTPAKRWAVNYLQEERKIKSNKLMVCLDGNYKNRIVIPYYDRSGKLIYFNSRSLSKKSKLRYLGPDKKEFGVGKGDVLWMSSWPLPGSKIYLTEGEFDAMSLNQCGLHSGACGGKTLTKKQLNLLKPYRIALAFDSDKAGKEVFEISQSIFSEGKMTLNGIPRVTIIRPPKNYKDWNNFFIHHNKDVIRAYINKFEQPCNSDTLTKKKADEIK